MKQRFPYYQQPNAMDCGPTCLRMIAKHYGKNYTIQDLRGKSYIILANGNLKKDI